MTPVAHLTADLVGVPAEQLRDAALLRALLIAAAGAAGVGAIGMPVTRQRGDGGLGAVLLADASHIVLHTFPEREVMVLDVLATSAVEARAALDVFARRLSAREIRSDTRDRG